MTEVNIAPVLAISETNITIADEPNAFITEHIISVVDPDFVRGTDSIYQSNDIKFSYIGAPIGLSIDENINTFV